jgi:hypothetical protein
MEGRCLSRSVRVVMGLALLAAALAIPGPSSASASTVWLCKPGAVPDPCLSSLQTTVYSPNGAVRTENPPIPKRPKIDCFYVYPTVSEDHGTNSDLSIDPEENAVAHFQASRFSQRCRVFAPMYRQLTLEAIFGGGVPASAVLTAYSDVAAAWQEYMRRYNKGRGVVLIGHSQGTGMLTQLVREMIDPFKGARKKLVSAMLLGGNVTVRQGSDVGGVFNHVPGCRTARRTGCVVAYSTFNATPPDNAIFGKVNGALVNAFGFGGRTDLQVLCTNPAALRGGPALLKTLTPTAPFPGALGFGVSFLFNGSLPTGTTPWLEPPDHYTGACVNSNGANVLMISPVGSARTLRPFPDASWGLHLADVNIALGNLVDLVGTQTKAYLRRRG